MVCLGKMNHRVGKVCFVNDAIPLFLLVKKDEFYAKQEKLMPEKDWIDYMVALGTVATPVLVLVLSAIGWKFRQSFERRIKLEEKLRDDRIEIYNQILEPFIILLMNDTAWASDPKNKGKNREKTILSKMLSLEYRKVSFQLSLIGSDPVVIAFNNLMQCSYKNSENDPRNSSENSKEIMSLLGAFLLEIRKSMGNDSTKIDNWGMLEWFITDIKKFRHGGG